jgi:hypothetical protein
MIKRGSTAQMAHHGPRTTRPTGGGTHANRQFSLSTVLVVVALVAVWLGLLQSLSGPLGMLILISPYFLLLYILYRVVHVPFMLASAYFALHAVACIISALFILNTTDGVERWVRSLPIIFIDMPVTFVLATWEPPGIIFPMYVFLAGGSFWAFVGWGFARCRRRTQETEFLARRQPEKSLYS